MPISTEDFQKHFGGGTAPKAKTDKKEEPTLTIAKAPTPTMSSSSMFTNVLADRFNQGAQNANRATTAPKTSISKFDSEVLNLLEDKGLSKEIVYDDYKMLANAYNGAYSDVKSKLKDDPETLGYFNKLEELSKIFKSDLSQPKVDKKRLAQIQSQANYYGSKIAEVFGSSSVAYRFNSETGKIEDTRTYQKNDPKVRAMDGFSHDARVLKKRVTSTLGNVMNAIAPGSGMTFIDTQAELVNDTPSYGFLMSTDARAKRELKKKLGAENKRLYGYALTNVDAEDNRKAVYNNEAIKMSTTMLNYIAKYGTEGGSDADKKMASDLLNKINSTGGNFKESVKVIAENRKKLDELSSSMGYYGNEYLFNSYKSLAKKPEFSVLNERMNDDEAYIKAIDKHQAIYKEFRGHASGIKTRVIGKLEGQISQNDLLKSIPSDVFKLASRSAFDERGNIISFESFKRNLAKENNYQPVKLNGEYWNLQGGSEGVGYNEMNQKFKEVYYNITKGYKKELDKEKFEYKHKESLIKLGHGNQRREAIGYPSVNMKVNEMNQLEDWFGPKQNNLKQVWDVLRNSNGSFGSAGESYIFPYNSSEDKGNVDLIERNELKEFDAVKSNKVMMDFIKNSKDLSDVSMTFLKYSNVPGYSIYKFTDNASGKTVASLINNRKLGSQGVKEELYMSSFDTLEEENFKITGEKPLKSRMNPNNKVVVKDPVIRLDRSGRYILEAKWPDPKVKGTMIESFMGDGKPVYATPGLTLEQATDYFNRLLNNISKEL